MRPMRAPSSPKCSAAEKAEIAAIACGGVGRAAAGHFLEIPATLDFGENGARIGLVGHQDVPGADLLLGSAARSIAIIAGAQGFVGHAGQDLAAQQRVAQLVFLGQAQAAADFLVAVQPGGTCSAEHGAVGDGAVHQLLEHLGRQHAAQKSWGNAAHFGRHRLGGGGHDLIQANLLAIDAGEDRIGVFRRRGRLGKGCAACQKEERGKDETWHQT